MAQLYRNCIPDVQKEVSKEFNLNYEILKSWIITIAALRNICAHHERLWNRSFTFTPKILNNQKSYMVEVRKFSGQFLTINNLIKIIDPSVNLINQFENHINKHTEEYLFFMGIDGSFLKKLDNEA